MRTNKWREIYFAAVLAVSAASWLHGPGMSAYAAQEEEYTGAFSIVEQEEYMNDPGLTMASFACSFAPCAAYPARTVNLHFHELETDTYYIFSTDRFQEESVTVMLPAGTYRLNGSTYNNGIPGTDYPVYMYPEQFTLAADGTVTDDSDGTVVADPVFIEIAHEKRSVTFTDSYQKIQAYSGFDGQLSYHLSGKTDTYEPVQRDYDVRSTDEYGSYSFYFTDIETGTYEVSDVHAYDGDGNEVNVYYTAEKYVKESGFEYPDYNMIEFYIYRDQSDLPEDFRQRLEADPDAWRTTQVRSTITAPVAAEETDISNTNTDETGNTDHIQSNEDGRDRSDKTDAQDNAIQKRESSRRSVLVFFAAAILVGVVEFHKNKDRIIEFIKERRKLGRSWSNMKNECIIPPNFALEGVITGGLKWRNVIEAGAIALLLGYPIFILAPLTIKARIYIGVIGLLPILIFAFIGIQGMSLLTYLFLFLKALKNRRALTYPDSRAKIARERKLLHKKQQRLRQMNGAKTKRRKNDMEDNEGEVE